MDQDDGDLHGRSASQQVARVLPRSPSDHAPGPEEQTVDQAEWDERMEELRSGLDLAQRFGEEGRSWVELDEDGAVVIKCGPGVDRG